MEFPQGLGVVAGLADVLMRDRRTGTVEPRGHATLGMYVLIRHFYLMVIR